MTSVISESEDIEIASAENKSTEVTTTESNETIPTNKKRKVGNLYSWVFKEGHFIKDDSLPRKNLNN